MESESESNGFSVGISSAGITFGGDFSRGNAEGTTYTNAILEAGNQLSITSHNDTDIRGANLTADHIVMDIGGNLTVTTVQNRYKSESKSGSASITISPSGAPVGGSFAYNQSNASRKFSDDVTSIIGRESVNIEVNDTLHLAGSTIAQGEEDGNGHFTDEGNLTITTPTLTYAHLRDYDKQKSFGISGQFSRSGESAPGKDSGSKINGTIMPSFASKYKEGITKATIGEGSIITGSTIDNLNRDVNARQVIIKDDETKISFVIPVELLTSEGRDDLKDSVSNIKKAFVEVADAASNYINKKEAITESDTRFRNYVADTKKQIAEEYGEEIAEASTQLSAALLATKGDEDAVGRVLSAYKEQHGCGVAGYEGIRGKLRYVFEELFISKAHAIPPVAMCGIPLIMGMGMSGVIATSHPEMRMALANDRSGTFDANGNIVSKTTGEVITAARLFLMVPVIPYTLASESNEVDNLALNDFILEGIEEDPKPVLYLPPSNGEEGAHVESYPASEGTEGWVDEGYGVVDYRGINIESYPSLGERGVDIEYYPSENGGMSYPVDGGFEAHEGNEAWVLYNDNLVSDAILDKNNKSVKIYSKPNRAFADANNDFDKIVGKSIIKDKGNGVRVSDLEDGTRIIVRPRSKDGRPTIEVNYPPGKKDIKVRYGDK